MPRRSRIKSTSNRDSQRPSPGIPLSRIFTALPSAGSDVLPRSPPKVQRWQVPLHLLKVVALEGELQVAIAGAPSKNRDVARREEGIGADVEGDVARVGDTRRRQVQ